MAPATAPPPHSNSEARQHAGRRLSRRAIVIIVVASTVAFAIVLVRSGVWPFSQAPVLQDLREASDSQLQVRSFHRTYFPFPGCVLEGVDFIYDTALSNPLIQHIKRTDLLT